MIVHYEMDFLVRRQSGKMSQKQIDDDIEIIEDANKAMETLLKDDLRLREYITELEEENRQLRSSQPGQFYTPSGE
jgi:hypothetical protein